VLGGRAWRALTTGVLIQAGDAWTLVAGVRDGQSMGVSGASSANISRTTNTAVRAGST